MDPRHGLFRALIKRDVGRAFFTKKRTLHLRKLYGAFLQDLDLGDRLYCIEKWGRP